MIPFRLALSVIEVEGAQDFCVNYGWIVENALFPIDFYVWIGAILVDCQSVFLFHHNQIAIFGFNILAAEKNTASSDAMLVVPMALCNNAEAVSCVDALKTLDTDGIVFSNRELMDSVCVNVR